MKPKERLPKCARSTRNRSGAGLQVWEVGTRDTDSLIAAGADRALATELHYASARACNPHLISFPRLARTKRHYQRNWRPRLPTSVASAVRRISSSRGQDSTPIFARRASSFADACTQAQPDRPGAGSPLHALLIPSRVARKNAVGRGPSKTLNTEKRKSITSPGKSTKKVTA